MDTIISFDDTRHQPAQFLVENIGLLPCGALDLHQILDTIIDTFRMSPLLLLKISDNCLFNIWIIDDETTTANTAIKRDPIFSFGRIISFEISIFGRGSLLFQRLPQNIPQALTTHFTEYLKLLIQMVGDTDAHRWVVGLLFFPARWLMDFFLHISPLTYVYIRKIVN